MLQKVPDAFADRRAAGLADQDGRAAYGRQQFDKQADLSALAASLRTLEANEETCLTHVGYAGDHES